jgi:hypothetical protein
MQWFAALIPAYPEIQARAHAELDEVVGRDRMPTSDDEPFLPYIRVRAGMHVISDLQLMQFFQAIIKEVRILSSEKTRYQFCFRCNALITHSGWGMR